MNAIVQKTRDQNSFAEQGPFLEGKRMRYPVQPAVLLKAREWSDLPSYYEEDDDGVDLENYIREVESSDPWSSSDINIPRNNPNTLGLHHSESSQRYIRPSHFVGAVWLKLPLDDGSGGVPLVVGSKFEQLDAVLMFATVLDHATLDLDDLFKCDPQGVPIPGVELQDVTLLQVAAYLATLSQFIQRDLRQGFHRIRENLNGRVKGRVVLADHVRQNLAIGRVDRAACEFTVLTMDTLENRILKTALEACALALAQIAVNSPPQLYSWLANCRVALAGVSEYCVTARDWGQVCKSGLMRAYAHPLSLARMILERLRVDADGKLDVNASNTTLPFVINMNVLFEAWVGVWLEKAGIKVIAQKEHKL